MDVRSIDELLKLDSYQNMNDAEIEVVIQWRERQAALKEKQEIDWLKIRLDAQATYEAELARAQHANEALDKLISKALGE